MPDVNASADGHGAATARRRGRPPTGARERLVGAMRELLMERDFDEISTAEVLARAGVSRGGMYHHFASKVELFKAAYEASERDALLHIASIAAEHAEPGSGPFDLLLAGGIAYVRECARPGELQRIGLRQSRAVLGWEEWRETAASLGIGVMKAGIEAAVDAGELTSDDITTTTYLVLATLIEAGLLAATDPDPAQALARIEPEVVRVLEGLRAA